MTKLTHEKFVKKLLKNSGVQKAYDALKDEFDLYEKMIKARIQSGMSQSDVAKEMKTSTSVVGRLETAGGKKAHSPTLATLLNYAHAVGCELEIKFKSIKHVHRSHDKHNRKNVSS